MKLTWNKIGRFLGYPECCIRAFVSEIPSEEQVQVANGTGFIPCKEHTRQVLSGQKKLGDLIKNRFFSVPFPASGHNDSIIDECERHYND